MIDDNSLMSTIQAQISKDVDQITRQYVEHQVNQLTLDATWLQKMDGHVRDAISRLLNKQIREIDLAPKIQLEIDQISSMIQVLVSQTAERCVEQYVQDIVQALAADQIWIAKMEQHINEDIARRFGVRFSGVDINTLVMHAIEPAVARYFERQRTAGHGLKDFAHDTELTLQDGEVKINDTLIAPMVKIDSDLQVGQTITVRDLVVKGTINTDNRSWQDLTASIAQQVGERLTQEWQAKLIESVAAEISSKGISFDEIKVDGHTVIDRDQLGSTVKRSSLTQVGTLETLQVSGSADLGKSLSIRSRRVGINTEHPDMALSVWDEEVALVFGKHKQQTAYIGTLRPQNLVIGINKSPAIALDDKGQVTIGHLTVGRHRICHETECPNYSGTKGDIVFNSNPKGDGVWGWQCLGAFRWIPLRSS